MDSDYALYQ
jgi:hypothetical protein